MRDLTDLMISLIGPTLVHDRVWIQFHSSVRDIGAKYFYRAPSIKTAIERFVLLLPL